MNDESLIMGGRLRVIRAYLNLTAGEFGKLCSVNASAIRDTELAKNTSGETLRKVAEALGCDAEIFIWDDVLFFPKSARLEIYVLHKSDVLFTRLKPIYKYRIKRKLRNADQTTLHST